jgi:hypothetical protein
MQCRPERRATEFQAALPILARDLFLARILAFFAMAWLPVASGTAMLLLASRPTEDAATLVEIGAGLSVLTLVAQSCRVREIAGSQAAWAVAAIVALTAAVPISLFVPRSVVLAMCAVICPILFRRIWRQLPTAFEVLPVEQEFGVTSEGTTTTTPALVAQAHAPRQRARPRTAPVWWPILHSLPFAEAPAPWSLLLMTIGGQWMYVSLFCIFPMPAALSRLSWPLGLPVRRGALLASILLLSLMPVLCVLLVLNWLGNDSASAMSLSGSFGIAEVRPPLEFWRTGKAPIIQSPWGESWQPKTERLSGLAIYNPFSFGRCNSPRFAEWQFQRATQALYGKAFDYRYLNRHEPGVHPVTRQARFTILSVSACASYTLLLVNLLFVSMHWRVQRVSRHGPRLLSALLVVQGALFLLLDFAPGNLRSGDYPSVSLVNALLLRVSDLLPAGLPAVALAAALPVALFWWTATLLFRGVEISRPADAAR